jgi:hypothetical protein
MGRYLVGIVAYASRVILERRSGDCFFSSPDEAEIAEAPRVQF